MKEREYIEGPEAPQKFDVVMRKIISVSKEELQKREKAWRRKRERAKKKRVGESSIFLPYFADAFSFARTPFSASSFCPASPSLPSAVRRW